jgi:GTP-binding protein
LDELISAEHGQGIGDLIDYTLVLLPKEEEEAQEEEVEGIAVAVLGKPNVEGSTVIGTHT